MQTAFDPYSQWLGLPEGPRPPDHYTLLGLESREPNVQAIVQAADLQMARLRRVRPGAHLAEWSRLLDSIGAVKVCLSNPASKAAYDASLPAASTTTRRAAPAIPAGQAPLALPPGMAAAAIGPDADTDGRPRVPFPVGYSQAPTLAAAGSTWSAPPGAPEWGGAVSTPTPLSTGPQMPWSGLRPAAAGQASMAPQQLPMATAVPAAAAPIAAYEETAYRPRRFGIVGMIMSVLLLAAVGGLGFVLYRVVDDPDAAQSLANAIAAPTEAPKETPANTPAPAAATQPAAPPTTASPATTSPVNGAIAPANAVAQGPTNNPSPTPAAAPAPAAAAAPQEDKSKRQAFQKAVSDARFAMSERDYAGAKKQLALARSSAQTPAESTEVGRLEQIEVYLEDFWKSMLKALPALEGGELPIGNTFISIVEANERHVLVKAAGQMRTYPSGEMPIKLINAIAEKHFKLDAGWKAVYGAFQAMDRDGDRSRARQLWTEAGKGGIATDLLMPELSVPLENANKAPGAKGTTGTAGGEPAKTDFAPQIADLSQRAEAAKSLPQHSEVAREALAICQQAAEAKNWDQAFTLAELAQAAAKDAKNVSMMRQAASALQQIDTMRRQR